MSARANAGLGSNIQVRRIFGHAALVLCCACEASEGRPDASSGSHDAQARDAAGADGSPAPADAAAVDEGGDGEPDLDAADSAQGLDAGTLDGSAGACSADACAATECSDERPCSAPETVCVDHACKPDPQAPAESWLRSTWSGRVGLVAEDDTTLWCTPSIEGRSSGARVASEFRRAALDGSQQQQVASALAAQRLRFQCFADATLSGPSSVVTSGWSAEAERDLVYAQCPSERPYAGFVRCQIAAQGKPPFVYAGSTCGDGVAGVAQKPSVRGQLLGDHYELGNPVKPLFNNTGPAAVMGTDLGYQFLAQGRMYMGFGDTWENEFQTPGPNGYRGAILAYTHDFDPSDQDGIRIEGWETAPERPNVAREVIPSPHDQSSNTEFTAIAASGFGLSEGGASYRFLWFAAIKGWSPFTTNESTLAWSQNGGAFVRGDQAAGVHPPRWPFDSYFGPGAIWVDREHGYVYFVGVRTYQAGHPLRLARVRATLAAVRDHLQYEYWTGSSWQHPDPGDEYALARLKNPAADLVPGSATQNSRPEFSLAYNPYVGRFTLLLHNDATPFEDEAQTYLQIWEAKAIEGPWTLVDTGDAMVLPPSLYGPYSSEQLQSEGGRGVDFLLSHWDLFPLILGQPYVVGLWTMSLERRLRPGCQP
jgi:Domain of unknown function (DUF4185)